MANGPMDRRAFGEQPDRPNAPFTGRDAEYTGRYVILLDQGNQESGLEALRASADIAPVERIRGHEAANVAELLERPDVSVLFEELGAAVVEVRPDQRHALVTTAEAEPSIIAAEPERMVYASVITAPQQAPTAFFPAYRSDEGVVERHTKAEIAAAQGPASDEQNWTWGLQAIRANMSSLTGRGVKIAVLDTGVDTDHPDLAGRIERDGLLRARRERPRTVMATARTASAPPPVRPIPSRGPATAWRARPGSSPGRCSATRAAVPTARSWRPWPGPSPTARG